MSQELADPGAVISCDGLTYDSFHGDERGIPYRKDAVGTLIAAGADSDDVFSGRLIRGAAIALFDLSIPMNGSLDFRVGAKLVAQVDDQMTFTIGCDDPDERGFWRKMFADSDTEADRQEPG